MNIALFAAPGLWAPLNGLLRWITPGTSTTAPPRNIPQSGPQPFAPESSANQNHPAGHRPANLTRRVQRRPLRVVRIMEAGQAPSQIGRMVISGCMADVCAELDRLAACEAAQH
jgi:hypothetical protein